VDSIPDYRDALRPSIAPLSSRVTKGRRCRTTWPPHTAHGNLLTFAFNFLRKKIWYAALFPASPLRPVVMKGRVLFRADNGVADRLVNPNIRQSSLPASAKDRGRNPKPKRKPTIPWRRSESRRFSKGSISNIPMSPARCNTKVLGSYWWQRFSLRRPPMFESTW